MISNKRERRDDGLVVWTMWQGDNNVARVYVIPGTDPADRKGAAGVLRKARARLSGRPC